MVSLWLIEASLKFVRLVVYLELLFRFFFFSFSQWIHVFHSKPKWRKKNRMKEKNVNEDNNNERLARGVYVIISNKRRPFLRLSRLVSRFSSRLSFGILTRWRWTTRHNQFKSVCCIMFHACFFFLLLLLLLLFFVTFISPLFFSLRSTFSLNWFRSFFVIHFVRSDAPARLAS